MENIPIQNNTKVWYWYIVSINRVGRTITPMCIRNTVGHQLVPKKVEILPLLTAPSFATPEQVAIEGAACIKAMHRERQMEGVQLGPLGELTDWSGYHQAAA